MDISWRNRIRFPFSVLIQMSLSLINHVNVPENSARIIMQILWLPPLLRAILGYES